MTDKAAEDFETINERKSGFAVTEIQDRWISPPAMLDRALTSGAPAEVIEKLMGLAERYEKNQARKAFDNAMADVRAKIPVILKNRHVGFEAKKSGAKDTSYKHEDLAQIARQIDPILAEVGLSYRYRVSSVVNEPVSVTCIVSHRDGHSEENTLMAGRDDSGNKNNIQAIGSTITYLQRYTLKAAFGLAAAADDDGVKADDEPARITPEQVETIEKMIVEVGADRTKFLTVLKIESLDHIFASKFDAVLALLREKKKGAVKA